ncbi:MAG: P-loop NTPase [Gammaproteobacteria bacterium]
MDLPESLVSEIRAGRVVLFLGAGATVGAKLPNGKSPPLGTDLRDELSKTFLAGKHKDESLAWVSELAISATNLSTVQDFIADQVRDLIPTDFHYILPTFKWRGIATTNYDRLTETVYERANSPIQALAPFVCNRDRIDEKMRSQNHVALLKLHGCITRTHDPELPLILTVDQYITHRAGRDRLFKALEEWGIENTIVFIGHAIQDTDLRAILLELSQQIINRPRYYLVKPNATDVERDLWGEKRITLLPGTFREFLESLDTAVPSNMRPLAQIIDNSNPIRTRFASNIQIGGAISDLLEHDVEYVHSAITSKDGSAPQFYKGFDLEWYPILNNLDVKRRLTETILEDVVIRSEDDRSATADLYVIKAEAGAGKSVFLKRLAWEANKQAGALCLVARKSATPSFEAIAELSRLTNERLFIFIDNAAENVGLISSLIRHGRKSELRLTIITVARVNEWNMECEELNQYVCEEYLLGYLSHSEIVQLVTLLRDHRIEAPNLKGKELDEQVRQFEEQAGRQLLVVLHEATMGKPFEEIILDEYKHIYPKQAQELYLTVCTLNRLNVPVRAGLIGRVHGISFTEFCSKLFHPLEHVVRTSENKITGDYSYTARHPEIAQMVFEQVLQDPTDRYNEYIQILQKLNISYTSDRDSFRSLIRAKTLLELFPRHEDAIALYEAAEQAVGRDAYLLQQIANYERIRPNGNLARAHELIDEARRLEPRDTSIIHTAAEVARARAESSARPLERMKFRNEARTLLGIVITDSHSGRYARVTLIKLGIDDLKDALSDPDSTDRALDEIIRAVETHLEQGKQQYPDDQYILSAEAEFGHQLEDNERSFNALKKAFRANPRDSRISIRLSRIYSSKGDNESAIRCMNESLQSNRSDKALNFNYAMLLRESKEKDSQKLAYHFRRAFTKWDKNYEAQFWFARYYFDSNDKDQRAEAKEIFHRLRSVSIAHAARMRIRDEILDSEIPKLFSGVVDRVESNYGFITTDGTGEKIFFHRGDIDDSVWAILRRGSRVQFNIGFNFGGPTALRLH